VAPAAIRVAVATKVLIIFFTALSP